MKNLGSNDEERAALINLQLFKNALETMQAATTKAEQELLRPIGYVVPTPTRPLTPAQTPEMPTSRNRESFEDFQGGDSLGAPHPAVGEHMGDLHGLLRTLPS